MIPSASNSGPDRFQIQGAASRINELDAQSFERALRWASPRHLPDFAATLMPLSPAHQKAILATILATHDESAHVTAMTLAKRSDIDPDVAMTLAQTRRLLADLPLAKNPATPDAVLGHLLVRDLGPPVSIWSNPRLDDTWWDALKPEVFDKVAEKCFERRLVTPDCPTRIVIAGTRSSKRDVQVEAFSHPKCPADILRLNALSDDRSVLKAIARNPSISPTVRHAMAFHPYSAVRKEIALSADTPRNLIAILLYDRSLAVRTAAATRLHEVYGHIRLVEWVTSTFGTGGGTLVSIRPRPSRRSAPVAAS